MEHTEVTTPEVEAQLNCAFTIPDAFGGIGTIEQQPHFAPVARRTLMAAVNTASRALGIRPSSVVVLDALMSCLPCSDAKTGGAAQITPLTLLTVFACNDTLCFRAKGITDRQLRRHLQRLEELNLIRRRDSANGKRFPIYRSGKVIGAFGLDLSPLLARSGEILALAQRHREEADELRGMKACIQKLRLECLGLNLEQDVIDFVDATRNFIRRAGITVLQAKGIIAKLSNILRRESPCATPTPDPLPVANQLECATTEHTDSGQQPIQQTGSDGQNVRHKETPKSYTKKSLPRSVADLWNTLTTIPAFYPNAPGTDHALMQLIFDFGRMLRIDSALLGRAVSILGLVETLRIADQIAESPDQVKSPNGYLATILGNRRHAKVGHGQHTPTRTGSGHGFPAAC